MEEDLENKKLKKEITKIKTDVYLSWLKFVVTIIGSFLVFCLINKPESIVNRKASKETISRERARLVLDLMAKQKNTNDILLGLNIIEKSYPKENNWVDIIREVFIVRKDKESMDSFSRNRLVEKEWIEKLNILNDLYKAKENDLLNKVYKNKITPIIKGANIDTLISQKRKEIINHLDPEKKAPGIGF